jgi:rhodanese-related sulfurtransferase
MSSLTEIRMPTHIDREALAQLLSTSNSGSTTGKDLAIIDVRDDDYIGGHIKGAQNVPSGTHDVAMPELARTLKDKKKVVFHCMLSQQRGPKAARRYITERERLLKGVEGNGKDEQEVLVLRGGFEKWQEL